MNPIKVLFLYQAGNNWLNLSPIYDAMCGDPRFQMEVWTVPSALPGQEYMLPSPAMLTQTGVPFKLGTEVQLESGDFDLALFATPYDEARVAEFRVPYVKERVKHIAYVPYALEMDGGEATKVRQYGQPAHLTASAIFVRSEYSRGMFRRHCPKGDAHVFATGLPRLDHLHDLDNRFEIDPTLISAINGRFPIMWNTHFSIEANRISTFDRIGPEILKFAANNPEIAIIWRPHPALFTKLVMLGVLLQRDIDALKRELAAAGVIVDQRDDHRNAFAASRALVTDMSSFLLEYLTTGKPVLYTINPDGLPLTDEGDRLIKNYETATTSEEVVAFIDRIQRGEDPKQARRQAALGDYFSGFDGHAAQRAVERLASIVLAS